MGSSVERADRKETGRTEAFSDGVFAFAITLLVLYLKDPLADGGTGSLLQGLLNQWPEFFAFVTSFLFILTAWIGHHEIFTFVRRVDRRFMFQNGFLLLFITLTPFTTSLVANHMFSSDSGTAAAIYATDFLLMSLSWGFLLRYASAGNRLIAGDACEVRARIQMRGAFFGAVIYAVALGVSFFSGVASVALILAVAIYYAVGPTSTA